MVVGIVGGVVALAVAGLLIIGWSVQQNFPEAEYKLELPQTMLNANYELAEDLSDTEGRKIEDEAEGAWDAKDVTAVVARYTLHGDENAGSMSVSGMYGRFQNTDEARDNMMEGAAQATGVTVAVEPQDFHPNGSDVTITCQVLTTVQAGTEVTVPMCAWADDNTGATIADIETETLTQDPDDVDLEKAAETALRVRDELRQPID
jgi:hypothetical protein